MTKPDQAGGTNDAVAVPTVSVLFFGRLTELMACPSVSIPWRSGQTAGELRRRLLDSHAAARDALTSAAVAVNERWAGDAVALEAGDVVAFLPPVSGG